MLHDAEGEIFLNAYIYWIIIYLLTQSSNHNDFADTIRSLIF